MDKQSEKIIPQADIDAWKAIFPDEIPERENKRPRDEGKNGWIDFRTWPL
jgi:hypothetical protein